MTMWFVRIHQAALVFALLCGGSLTTSSQVAAADPFAELEFVTENYAPFNYEADGKVVGQSVALLLKMFAQAGSSKSAKDIKILPWARGYILAQQAKNTVLFSTTRTKAREKLFKWVGPILPTTVAVIARKDLAIKLTDLSMLGAYNIVAVRKDIGELLLKTNGVREANIYSVGSAQNAAKMLAYGRVDLWAYEKSVAFWNLEAIGENLETYEVLRVLEESDVYFAIQKDTPDRLVRALQNALDTVRARE